MVLNILVIHCLFINQTTCAEKISFIYAPTFHMHRKTLKIVCIWQVDHCDNKGFKQQDVSLFSVTSSNFVHTAQHLVFSSHMNATSPFFALEN